MKNEEKNDSNFLDINEDLDREKRNKNITVRLSRIQGQVKGIEKMILTGSECKDILVQISAIKAAINKVGTLTFEYYAKNCTREFIENNEINELFNTLMLFTNKSFDENSGTLCINEVLSKLHNELEIMKKLIHDPNICKKIILKVTIIKSLVNRLSSIVFENYAKHCTKTVLERQDIDELISTILIFTK